MTLNKNRFEVEKKRFPQNKKKVVQMRNIYVHNDFTLRKMLITTKHVKYPSTHFKMTSQQKEKKIC